MSGTRLVVGIIMMGVALPLTLFFLLGLHTISQFLTVAGACFLTWGIADILTQILERPRLQNRTPTAAFREDFDRRAADPREH